MSDHLLKSDDIHTIQDYFVTKIHFLLATHAEPAEWEQQYRAQREIDLVAWVRQNAFLWDYTLARYIAAVHIRPYTVLEHATPAEQFMEEFVHAVSLADGTGALGVWDGINEFAEADAHDTLPSSEPLMHRIRALNPDCDLAEVTRNLPEEYEHPQWVS